jgi:lipoprotein-anchoring transpeptidase ErfK/SrfK
VRLGLVTQYTSEPEADISTDQPDETKTDDIQEKPDSSVLAETHSKSRAKKARKLPVVKLQKRWHRNLSFGVGITALVVLVLSGMLSQYYKNKTLPNVVVAGINSGAKDSAQLKAQLESQYSGLKVTLQSADKKLEPKLEEVGLSFNVDQTIKNSLEAKRAQGLLAKISFWKKYEVPAVITINDTLLQQYIDTYIPEMTKPPQDAQLQFDVANKVFIITNQADGQGPDTKKLKQQLVDTGKNLQPSILSVDTTTKKPVITQAKLEPLLVPANSLVSRKIVLTGLGYTFQATPSEIAGWITPTPQENGDLKLVVDPGKIQSYVESISKRISSAPIDQKVIKDEATGAEVVLQSGRNGTELADRQVLSNAIAQALQNQQDTTQTMNIKTAAFGVVNMNAFDKWIEVDLSEQRTTAYEKATPIRNFTIASGMRGYETVTGEFSIWLKTRRQTMSGGSKADGSYYSIPNVEWVSYFYKDYALHGAWWREKFGAPASHGCVNMTNADAQWVFEWAPVGTKVIVHQ